MEITKLGLGDVTIIEPTVYMDYRGYYTESYSQRSLSQYDINNVFVQDNQSFTKKMGTIRGIHFQNNPAPQAKLVRCTQGKILDVVVDLRKDSTTYKKWMSIELTAENCKEILIPNGYGHAFLTLTDNCIVQYKVDEFYEPVYDRTIVWNDPDINIDWPIIDPILSEKDKNAHRLKDSDCNLNVKVNP